jgi:predicted Zn-dependent protease
MRHHVHAGLSCVVALGLLVGACATNPVTGQRQFTLISEGQEIEMGRAAAADVERTIGLVDDAELQAYVRRVGLDLARRSERPSLPWTFGVVDDPSPNAFALPGGFIYLTRGMVGLMRSEAEMASVLGHEIGHVTARHSVQQISQQQLAQIGLGVGGILLPEIQQYGDLLGAGLSLLFLRHSRDAERQADDLGFRYALNGGYDTSEMADVFAALERLSGEQEGALPTFLATHPSPGERVATINAKVQALPASGRGSKVAEAEYLRQIDGLVFGDDPMQGYFRDGEFLHPALRFRFAFPRGWSGQNMRQAVVGVSPQRNAALQLTLAESSPQAAAQTFASENGITLSDASSETINGLTAVVARFEATTQDGRIAGIGSWISHGGRTYQLLTYAPSSAVAAQNATFEQIITSFGPLRDASALNVQPQRIDIVTISQRQTLAEFNQRQPSGVPINTLAVLNDVAGPSTVLPPGTLAKRIVGAPVGTIAGR